MPRRNANDNIMMGPLPNARLPWLVILLLLVCLWLVYWAFLTPPDKLLGPKIRPNEYQRYMTPPRPRAPQPVPPAPAAQAPSAPSTPPVAPVGGQ